MCYTVSVVSRQLPTTGPPPRRGDAKEEVLM